MNSQRTWWSVGVLIWLSQANLLRADKCQDLLEKLDKAKPREQVALVHRIGNLGRNGQAAIPVLADLLHSPKNDLANQAARSLAQIGQPSVIALATAAKDAAAKAMSERSRRAVGAFSKSQ